MPRISAIKQQQRRQDRYSIYVDEKYVCSFSEAELIKLGLHSGQEMSEADVAALKDNSIRDKAYTRALDLISRRPRSEWELRDYFRRKEYDEAVADYVVDRLRGLGYVDDLDFARRWVDNRRTLKATSQRRLSQELRQKRIADEIIEQVLQEDETDEIAVLRELIERKRKQTKYQDDTKLMQFLSRQGFGYGDIRSAMSDPDD